MPSDDTRVGPNPSGFCMCGCGQPAPIAGQSNTALGIVAGLPKKYIFGHKNRLRIEENHVVNCETGCHLWLGTLLDGYARGTIGGRLTLIHKHLWEQKNGPVPEGHHLHHRCTVKRCINVDHLELLTQPDHMREHGRLTWDDVAEIRALRGKVRLVDLALRFGVTPTMISRIQLGKAWKQSAA